MNLHLRTQSEYAASAILMVLLLISVARSGISDQVTISSFGTIGTGISPLHTEGRYIKDNYGRTVFLRGVWKAEYADSCVGWWGDDPYNWDETKVRADMQNLRDVWKANVVNTFIWGDWWLEDKSVTLGGFQTSQNYRYVIKETLRLAMEYGLYVQLRLYGAVQAEGRGEAPYQPYSSWSLDDFVGFWRNISNELKYYPNAIFTLYDEPTGDLAEWFEAADRAIAAIRATGAENLIAVHWAYCGDCLWMEDWVNQGFPIYNILFSNHIYRFHGTFEYNPNSPVDIDYIRTQLGDNVGNHRAYKYITDTYNIPIWVSAIGAYAGYSDDMEYIYFRNTLAVLNEWGLSYVAYQWFREMPWFLGYHTPNRVGQALIDSIMGETVPAIYYLSINSNLPVDFKIDESDQRTPFGPSPSFGGTRTIEMPLIVNSYSHMSMFGNTEIGGSSGFAPFIYTAGPYYVATPSTVSDISLYTKTSGNTKVALYSELNGDPNALLTESATEQCSEDAWHTFDVPDVTIQPGNYFIAIKIDKNGMLSGTSRIWFGKFRTQPFTSSFPNPFGPVEGATGAEYSVYIPSGPIQVNTYEFDMWENGSTDPTRIIDVSSDMSLTATYEPTT